MDSCSIFYGLKTKIFLVLQQTSDFIMISVVQFYINGNFKITIMNIERTEFRAWMEHRTI